jgi:hypothetical protein
LLTAENAEVAELAQAETLNRITESVIGAAIEVHRALGPGLLESAYEACLEEVVIVEVKAVDHLAPVHTAQLLSYLKLSGCHVGLLINFNVKVLKDGLRRVVNDFPESLRSQRSQR